MKILFYDTKIYDKESFNYNLKGKYKNIVIDYLESDISVTTAGLASGYDAVCVFVASNVNAEVIKILSKCKVKLILLRCAGYNNVNLKTAEKYGITVMRVPAYSPEAVAEHAVALALAVNRKIHKAYIKVRENNFSLVGLTGRNFHSKTAGIIGTGKIGTATCKILKGFGMKILAVDDNKNKELDFVTYTDLDTLLKESDLISLHCPLTTETYHLIDKVNIEKMKDGVLLVNTSRGALINTNDLIDGIRDRKFVGVGLDVYEEEDNNVFENREDDILESSITARLLSFPNVIVTSHQGFLTGEALSSIAITTLENSYQFENGTIIDANLVKATV
ncbi:MAG: 2-hydroxyacid dehydrogenase [Ruminococcaceae bacterium]|nr:2-hydroxyacid dehydrogenase [Oscillospiraceae bacterium]